MLTFRRLITNDSGASLTEYALLIGLLAIVVVGVGQLFGAALYGMYLRIAQTLSAA